MTTAVIRRVSTPVQLRATDRTTQRTIYVRAWKIIGSRVVRARACVDLVLCVRMRALALILVTILVILVQQRNLSEFVHNMQITA